MNKVSVIVPVYNVEKYLNRCIDSLLSQKYNNYEIILVNDGSTDKSGFICDEYAKKYSNITVVHKENEGLGYARNTGTDYATGDYIVFIDSDDFANNELIDDLCLATKEVQADICIGGYNRVDLEDRLISTHSYEKNIFTGKEITNLLIPRMIGSLPDKKDSISVSACNVLYSKEIIDKYNIRFVSERDIISEDLIFNISYLTHVEKVVIIDKSNYNYRINLGSLTTKYLPERFDKIKELYYKEIDILENIGIYDKCKFRLMRQFFIYVKMCLAQENHNVNNKKFKQLNVNVNDICNDKLVEEIVNVYPIHKLDVPQKIFLYLIKYKITFLISLFIKMKIIK